MSTLGATPSAPPGGAEVEERARLVHATAAFARAYLRWVEATGCGGLSYPRLRALEELRCDGPTMMRDLAEKLALTPRNLTALVDSLEAEGLVDRRQHPTDRRATLVALTDAGAAFTDTTMAPLVETIGQLFDDLSPAARRRFADSVEALLDGLRERGQRA